MTPSRPLLPALRGLPLAGQLSLVALLLAVIALTIQLWPQWRVNPDLSHGFFMPLLFVLLLHEGRTGSQRFLKSSRANNLTLAAVLGGALLALGAAGLYSASTDWSHALVNLMLALSAALLLTATALVMARESLQIIPFNWPVLVAAWLWLLVTPIPPGTYSRLTLTLQLWVSQGVLQSLHLLGIAAIRHGNIIDLANTSVGVEEACSGVRSLISCGFAGVFFSATLVRRPWARFLVIALAAPIALAMNFIRSLTLTLLANNHVDISGTWHDATGFAVLGLTAAILGALAVMLERERPPTTAPLPPEPAPRRSTRPQWALLGTLGAAAALVGFFVWNTRPSTGATGPVPNLAALLPDAADGWQTRSPNLYEFRGTLQTEHLAQRDYRRASTSGAPDEIVIYVAYWRAGQASVSLVASHTPDACWPGSGWTIAPNSTPRVALRTSNRNLPEAEQRVFTFGDQPQHVWFWHIHDGRPIAYRDPYSAVELLKIAWKYGFRRNGDQLFVRVSSNRPWAQIADEPVLRSFFERVQKLGL